MLSTTTYQISSTRHTNLPNYILYKNDFLCHNFGMAKSLFKDSIDLKFMSLPRLHIVSLLSVHAEVYVLVLQIFKL